MCDTAVIVPDEGPVWFAKNSDREPTEAQYIECHEPEHAMAERPSELPDLRPMARVLLSRPAWMWGCEMGVNQYGVAIGNEAVFTRLPTAKAGYSGMDFQRLALAHCRSADDALENLIELTEALPQGGRMGHRSSRFRYHSSFVVADPRTAWVLETAGRYWAAKRVRGAWFLSNGLTITDDFDRVHRGALRFARSRGWIGKGGELSFADAFGDRTLTLLAGASARRACTSRALSTSKPEVRHFIHALSDHAHTTPGTGWRFEAPCGHASWLPTMRAAQTTASLVARLDPIGPEIWATGTSSPCLSVFKPAPFDPRLFPARPVEEARFDLRELWWSHERLHRACLLDYVGRRVTFAEDRERLQSECLVQGADPYRVWEAHRKRIGEWLLCARAVEPRRRHSLRHLYGSRIAKLTRMPAG